MTPLMLKRVMMISLWY